MAASALEQQNCVVATEVKCPESLRYLPLAPVQKSMQTPEVDLSDFPSTEDVLKSGHNAFQKHKMETD